MTEPTYTFNKDGSIELPVDGKPIKFVKESDLLAVKGGAETRSKEWEAEKATYQAQVAEATRLRDETHQSYLKAQAEYQQLVEKTKDYDTHKNRVSELEKEIATHKDGSGKMEKELADIIREGLVDQGAKPDSIKDLPLDQLRSLQSAAKILGTKVGRKPNYDGGGHSGNGQSESPIDRAHRILAEHEEKGHRIGAKGAPAPKV